MKIYYFFFFILQIKTIPLYYTFDTNGDYLKTAYNSYSEETLVTFADGSNSHRYVINNLDGTINRYYKSSTTYLPNSSLFFLPSPFSIYIMANRESYVFDMSAINTIKTLTMSQTFTQQTAQKASLVYNVDDKTFFVFGTGTDFTYSQKYSGIDFSTKKCAAFSNKGNTISCIFVKKDSKILCFYHNSEMKEQLAFLDSSTLNVDDTKEIDPENWHSSIGESVISSDYDNNRVLYCILKGDGYYLCNVGEYTSTNNFNSVCPTKDSFAVLYFCDSNILYSAR